MITEREVREKLNEFLKGKSRREAAKQLGISRSYLHEIRKGTRKLLVPPILKKFGYEKETVITKKEN